MKEKQTHPAVGIDLGTTFSAVAYLDCEDRPTTVRNAEGDLTTPSAVFFDRSTTIVGAEALKAGEQEPRFTPGSCCDPAARHATACP